MENFIYTSLLGSNLEAPQMARRNSQESNISEALSHLSFVTANSDLSSIDQNGSTFASAINLPQERYVPVKTRSTNESLESATQSSTGQQVHQVHEGVSRPQYDVGKGYCLIINQIDFPDGPRTGTNNDAKLLKDTFQKLNFDVKIGENLTANGIKKALRECCNYLNQNSKEYYIMCICLLSHGDRDEAGMREMIYGVDQIGIHIIEEIVFDIFNSKNCPAMIAKPKLFVSNACRGRKELPGIKVKVISYV